MAVLSLRNFTQVVQDAAAAAQSACVQILDFTTGSIERVLMEANAGMVLWLQVDLLQVLAATRLATSFGGDVDTFVNDYGLTRLPAVAATVPLYFARANPTGVGTVLAGLAVKTADGTVTFTVNSDPTNAYWNGTGYTLPVGVAGCTVIGTAVVPGTFGNVGVGAVALLAGSFPGVDTVTNLVAATGGLNAESDAALKVRYPLYIASLRAATVAAINYAVSTVQQGLTSYVSENTPRQGSFLVTVDDGSGSPPAALLAAVAVAVNAVRPVGSVASVAGPVVVGVAVNVLLTLPASTVRAPVVAIVAAAISAYLASLPVGAVCSYGYVNKVIFDAVAGITNASVTLNGGMADVVPGVTGVCRASTVTVS